MLAPINNYSGRSFESLGFTKKNKYDFFSLKPQRELTKKEKAGIALSSIAGTILPLIYMTKKQKTPLHKLKYGEKQMIMLSTGSIGGGVLGGIITENGGHKKEKIQEGIFQFFNAVIPTLMIKPILYICENIKALNNHKIKAPVLLGGIFSGMVIGSKISNKINKNNTYESKRNVKLIDTIANIDVISGALIMAKFTIVHKLGIEKFLPLIYSWTGYQSGKIR